MEIKLLNFPNYTGNRFNEKVFIGFLNFIKIIPCNIVSCIVIKTLNPKVILKSIIENINFIHVIDFLIFLLIKSKKDWKPIYLQAKFQV